MFMDAYEIVMVCIASVTLVLKVIQFIVNLKRK